MLRSENEFFAVLRHGLSHAVTRPPFGNGLCPMVRRNWALAGSDRALPGGRPCLSFATISSEQ